MQVWGKKFTLQRNNKPRIVKQKTLHKYLKIGVLA